MCGKQKNMFSTVEIFQILLKVCEKLISIVNDSTCNRNQLQLKKCL